MIFIVVILFSSVLLSEQFSQTASAQNKISVPDSVGNNFFKLRDMRKNYWDTIGIDKRKGEYRQFKRWEYFWENRVMPDGSFPEPQLYLDAWKRIEKEKENLKGSVLLSTPIWDELGPTSDPVGSGVNAGVGRVNVIRSHPTNSNEIWAASASGGVWRSFDAGANWHPLAQTEFMSLGVSDIAISKSNPNVIYVATGDNDGSYSSSNRFYSIGVIKSIDGGATWRLTGDTVSLSNARLSTRLWVHPNNENIVIVATNREILKSTDGGATWINTTPSAALHFVDIEQKPDDPNVLYASTQTSPNIEQPRNFIYKSINAGDSWDLIKTIDGARRTCIEVSPDFPDAIYALSANKNGGFLSLIMSSNSGESWNNTNIYSQKRINYLTHSGRLDDKSTEGQGWYDLAMAVNPENINEVYIGGINIWRSIDGGENFSLVAQWMGQGGAAYVHADIHDLKFIGNKLYAGHDGGIDYTANSGSTWKAINNGLGISQNYRFDNSRQNDYNIITGLQDLGTRRLINKTTWEFVAGGDGMDCAFDPKNDARYYSSLYYGKFFKYENGRSTLILDSTIVANRFNINDVGAWVTPFAIDASNPNNIYIGYANIYHSNDYGKNWRKLTNYTYSYSNSFRNMRVSESNGKYIYASTFTNLIKSNNAGETWSVLNPPGQGNISDICIHPTNPDVIYITRSSFVENSKVFMYDGSVWTNLSGNLPNVPANCVFYQKKSPDRIYIGTDVGVYTSDRNVPYYKKWGAGLPNLCINDIEIVGSLGKLRAASYGRGTWEVEVKNCTSDIIEIDYEGSLTFCNGDSVKLFSKNKKIVEWSTGEISKEIWVKKQGDFFAILNPEAECPIVSNIITTSVMSSKELTIGTSKHPEMCLGDTLVLSIPIGFKNDSYLWSDGSTERKLIVTKAGIYWASAEIDNGCRSYDTVIVTTYPKAEKPTITVLEGAISNEEKLPDTLLAPEAEKYKWYRDNKILLNETSQLFVVRTTGNYSVEVSNGGECWSERSEEVSSIDEATEISNKLILTPNPAKNFVELEIPRNYSGIYDIILLDIAGKSSLELNNIYLGNDSYSIDISKLASGTYFIKLVSGKYSATKKLIKK